MKADTSRTVNYHFTGKCASSSVSAALGGTPKGRLAFFFGYCNRLAELASTPAGFSYLLWACLKNWDPQ